MQRIPIDERTPIGYIVVATIHTSSFIFMCHILVLGLGILLGYFGVATACAEDIRRKIRDAAECWDNDKNLATVLANFKSILTYTSQLKELSLEFSIHRIII